MKTMQASGITTPGRVPHISLYREWLARRHGWQFANYEAMWRWSVQEPDQYWQSLWEYRGMVSPTPWSTVLSDDRMPGARWFEGASVNYSREVLRHVVEATAADQPAIISDDESGQVRTLSWVELKRQVASLALTLRERGIGLGDPVAACLANTPEAVVCLLACASIGAVWSVCAPDMGAPSVLDRFRQIEPRILIVADGVHYAGKSTDRREIVDNLRDSLSSVDTLIVLRTSDGTGILRGDIDFDEAVSRSGPDVDGFEPIWLPFAHPLWILYSSGTTGLPKALVHSHGGVILTAFTHALHVDLGPSYDLNSFGERYHWYSSTGWVMWNAQVNGLLTGTTICLFDGSPSGPRDAPDWSVLWRFASRSAVTFFGAGAAFYAGCVKVGLDLGQCGDLTRIRTLGSTGSPLPAEVQSWGSDQFAGIGSPEVWWCIFSGGTDVAGAFVTANPELPPAPGKMQCRQLGAAVDAWDENGKPVVGRVGELVCTRPMPSMPLYLWGDEDGSRYRDSYFATFPGVWRHGDWLRIDSDGTCAISGRSDATVNRGGLRIGTSEIYSAVEAVPEVLDSLAVDIEDGNGGSRLLLFVALRPGSRLDVNARSAIVASIRSSLSPRFIPDELLEAPGIPRTITGKKQEVPIKRLILGDPLDKILNRDAMANPEVLGWYVDFAGASSADRAARNLARVEAADVVRS